MIIQKHNASRSKLRRSKTGASIAEFGAAFYAFCIVIMLPTINFLSFAIAYSYSFLCANGTADHVAQAISPKRAFQILDENSTNLNSDPLAHLFKIKASEQPFKLALVKTNSRGDSLIIANNIKDIKKLLNTDENANLIQYEITSSFTQQPLLELGSIPIINQIPLIGKESILSFKMLRHPEHLSDSL
jgi:hypothetical protein